MPTPPLAPHAGPLFLAPPLAVSSDPTHARLVSALVHLLFGLGFRSIRTDAGSWTHPTAPHRPDVTARSGRDTLSLFAVETTSSLDSERAAQRLRALARDAGAHELWLAVPPESRVDAIRRLRDLQLDGRVIGV